MNAEQAWQATLGELQLQLTKSTFDTWLKHTHVISCEDGTFLVGVNNGYAKDWLENRLLTMVKRTLTGIVNHTVDVRFVVRPKSLPQPPEEGSLLASTEGEFAPMIQTRERQPSSFNTGLNPKYTFESFIVGNSTRLAHAAARAVAENPGKSYNPLFIYGGVGLGKTHLLQAIGNLALSYTPNVLYISSETFTNELINAIRTQ
ncbi:MAG: chromosomal replication initiator protein DnaA, partial [Chloroflexi bacterium]|nr:chromosomal replication initiator protein DnaA [Chloroflexota bacterium]